MRLTVQKLLLGSVLLCGSAALARDVKEFAGGTTTRVRKQSAGSNVTGWNGEDAPVEVKDPPWMAIGLGVIVLAIATPFGLRMYRDTAAEVEAANAPSSRRSKTTDEA